MPLWGRLSTLWRNLRHQQQLDDELAEEIHSYRQMLEDDKARSGIEARRAQREALLEVGGVEQIKEQVRDVRVGRALEGTWTEVRQCVRALARNPAIAGLAVVMLALGIAATTVVFSVFYAALLQPLPFRDTDRLVQIWETRLDRGWSRSSFTEANFWDLRTHTRAFEEVAAYDFGESNLTGNGPAERVSTVRVTSGFFRTLGVATVIGRDFTYDEDRPGRDNQVVLLGNRFWTNRFGADPQIIGKTLRLNEKPYTVVGVLPPGQPWINSQTYIPFVYRPAANRTSFEYAVIGRLAGGYSIDGARGDLKRISAFLAREYPKDDTGLGFLLEPASTWIASDTTRRALTVLLAAVGFLMLIACVNLANLLLARATARTREIAVRTALGASRARLVQLVLTESTLLSAIGTALGLLLAYLSLDVIKALDIRGVPRLADASLNPWVLGFTGVTGLLTGILSGLAPALQAPSSGIATALRDGDRSQAGSRTQARLRATLVTAEVALSFLLLVGAGLLIRSFSELVSVNRGFQTENRLLFSISMPGSYWEKGVGKRFIDSFLERVSALPQVVSAGAVSHRPIAGGNPGMGIVSASRQNLTGRDVPWATWRIISPTYLRVMGLPLRKGRQFAAGDETGKPWRVLISERLAKLIFPNEDPIGKRAILWRGQSNLDAEVIGVLGDMRERGLSSDPTLAVYLPYGLRSLPEEFVLQSTGDPLALISSLRAIVAEMDSNLPMSDIRSFDEVVNRSLSSQRFNTILFGVFSGLALLLATTGIYGVLSYSVSRRTSEIGVRLALGASAPSILRMTIGQGLRPAFVGIALGVAGALWLSRYLTTLLYGIQPFDAITYLAVAVLLLATAMLSCYLPARRATRIDPVVALRIE